MDYGIRWDGAPHILSQLVVIPITFRYYTLRGEWFYLRRTSIYIQYLYHEITLLKPYI